MLESTEASNLSPECRARDLGVGVLSLGGTLLLATLLAKLGVHWGWRLLLIVPFIVTAHGFLNGLYGT